MHFWQTVGGTVVYTNASANTSHSINCSCRIQRELLVDGLSKRKSCRWHIHDDIPDCLMIILEQESSHILNVDSRDGAIENIKPWHQPKGR